MRNDGFESTNPHPRTLNKSNLAHQIEDSYNIGESLNIEAVILYGSFATPEKPVDRNNVRSDVDIFFVVSEETETGPVRENLNKAPTVTLEFDENTYQGRVVDKSIGVWEEFMSRSPLGYIELPVSS